MGGSRKRSTFVIFIEAFPGPLDFKFVENVSLIFLLCSRFANSF